MAIEKSATIAAAHAMAPGGLRERKRRATRLRIAETALQLFIAGGYERTTLDAIAIEAGISRRTFFRTSNRKTTSSCLDWRPTGRSHGGITGHVADVRPLDAVRDLMVKRIARFTTEQMKAVDDLMMSSASLLARKQIYYAEQEAELFGALCEVWRQPRRRAALRMVAVVAIGAQRIALQAWREQTGPQKPAAKFLRDAFDSLRSEL